jgi:uncharacterized protein with ParB-like and HNH nuclease domain
MGAGVFLKDVEFKQIFKNHLNIQSTVYSIESLLRPRMLNKINFKPYYQRNYVWDNDKATYFIESILIGTEIPPLVFFNNGTTIEIIDGRQRFETILNFYNNKFHLTKKGLNVLKDLTKKSYDDLNSDTIELFLQTAIRIIEFKIVNEPRLDERLEDLIKKEIFRRYNSGITPLKNVEIDKAKYIEDDITTYFKNRFKETESVYNKVLELFFLEKDKDKKYETNTIER